jgi:hypothetical protein
MVGSTDTSEQLFELIHRPTVLDQSGGVFGLSSVVQSSVTVQTSCVLMLNNVVWP